MDKIAVISDIHGNLEATKTVLKDIKKRKINLIYCLGDIVGKGAHPNECIDLIMQSCKVILRGNLEEFVLGDTESFQKKKEKKIFYTKQIDSEHINKIKDLPICHELYISGSLIRFFHASPIGVWNRISEHDEIASKMSAFYPCVNTPSNKNADIAIFGDLHTQFMQKFYNKTLINVGSVGCSTDIIRDDNIDSNAIEITQAFYLIIEGELNSQIYNSKLEFNFIRVPYDIEKELNTNNETFDKEAYENEIRKGIYRDQKIVQNKYKL